MSIALRELSIFIFSGLVVLGFIRDAIAAHPLLRVGKPATVATFFGAPSSDALQFRIGDEIQRVGLDELVRWANPASNLRRAEVLLVDGSRLVLADSWTGQPPWEIESDQFLAETNLFGRLVVPSNKILAILVQTPIDWHEHTKFIDSLPDDELTEDRLRLTNGDVLLGRLLRVDTSDPDTPQALFTTDPLREPLQISMQRVTSLVLGSSLSSKKYSGRLLVGMTDGSLLTTESLFTDDKNLRIALSCGVELTATSVGNIASLRSLKSRCAYLSDLTPSEYRHMPYLDIHWPYSRDCNVLTGPLRVSERIYTKGLGMITAARLTYDLDSVEIAGFNRRLVAEVALDDSAGDRGSVIFRVYVHRKGEWREVYASPIVRGGDAPLPVELELNGAKQLALTVDFADRGDECDYANWLDARLE